MSFKFVEIYEMNYKSIAEFCAAVGICTVASIQIVIYYRRRFSISMQSMQLVLLMILSVLVDRIDPLLSLTVLFVGCLIMWRQILENVCTFDLAENVKFLICWIMLLSMTMQLANIFEYSNEIAFVMAFLQQLRKPSNLKIKLGPVRVLLGPPYVIAMACTCIKEDFTRMSAVRFIASFLASTLFRPDNTATLEIIKMDQMFSSRSRRIIHGILMTLSTLLMNKPLAFIILVLYLYGKFHDQIWVVLIASKNFLLKAIAWTHRSCLFLIFLIRVILACFQFN